MNVFSIALNNLKNNIKIYSMFFISMIFSVFILVNFELLLYGDIMQYIGKINKDIYIVLLKCVIAVLIIFMIFFIWYSTNIFLRKRKKEIGIYVFSGLDLFIIGKIYFIEVFLMGLSSCIIGISLGTIFSKFFQMIILKISGYELDVAFEIGLVPILNTILIFMTIFLIMTLKGFFNIYRSKIINLLNAHKKETRIPKVTIITYIVAAASVIITIYAYILAVKACATENMGYVIYSTLFIIIGSFGFFGSVLSIIFNMLINTKKVLYAGNNIITINNLSYRFKKNYKIYAIITILITTTISTLGVAISSKTSYDKQMRSLSAYTFSFVSNSNIDTKPIKDSIWDNKIMDDINTKFLYGDDKVSSNSSYEYRYKNTLILEYNDFINILKYLKYKNINDINENMVKNNNVIVIDRENVIDGKNNKTVTEFNIGQDVYKTSYNLSILLFGSMSSKRDILVVSKDNYEKIKEMTNEANFYGIKLENDQRLYHILNKINSKLTEEVTSSYYMDEIQGIKWLTFSYAIGVVLFLAFLLATGTILYMKIYSDAYEDKEKYLILLKMGVEEKEILGALKKEISLLYAIPLLLASIHSYFPVKILNSYMELNLVKLYISSIGVCIFVFIILYVQSIRYIKQLVLK